MRILPEFDAVEFGSFLIPPEFDAVEFGSFPIPPEFDAVETGSFPIGLAVLYFLFPDCEYSPTPEKPQPCKLVLLVPAKRNPVFHPATMPEHRVLDTSLLL